MNRRWIRTAFLCMAALAGAGQALAADKPPAGTASDLVTLNFVNAEIEGVVKVVGDITGKNFVLDPRVKGTVNIVSARPISRALVYQTFLSALRVQGFSAVEDRGVVMIVPETDAKFYRGGVAGPQDKSLAAGDTIRTQVFKLQHQSAAQMVPILRPLIPTNNTIAAYQSNNTLVVTDYASNLRRIQRIIEAVDQPNDTNPVIIQLEYASALDVAHTITRLLSDPAQAPGDPTQRFTITADSRSNSVLAHAGDPSRLTRVRQLAAMLDSPTSAAGNIHVIYLKNAVAVKVAEVLRAIYSGESGPAAAAPRPAASPLAPPQQTPGSTAPLAPGIIQADAATNSIIITAPDAIYNNLRAAVEKLDVRRAQVYVEALIAEVSADKAAEFGIQWQNLSALGKSDAQAFGGTNFGNASQNIISLSQNPAGAGRGLNVGVVNGTITIPGVGEIFNLNFLVRALQTDSNSNILATPTLLTLDNEEAKIVIGQNVPFITGQYALSGSATTPTPFQTIERKDVGLTLRVKPQISEGGAIRMQIFQEVSLVTDTTNPAGIITNKRAVESTVLIDHGQIVVIGGLIQDTIRDGVEKVPGLGDLPVIGGLFRYNTRSRSKVNLMVFLRPVVLRTAQAPEMLSRDRYDYILGEQLKQKPMPSLLPEFQPPTLPPVPDSKPPETRGSAADPEQSAVPAQAQ